ncbi:MAG: hypothetical protein A2Z14_09465 [Chloroflexi bacterium RBG_16_48_8]|nr:MAG: hypothetical protein A2Z14_09465 [Chloroflexi bacterium RBG_16_48_8]
MGIANQTIKADLDPMGSYMDDLAILLLRLLVGIALLPHAVMKFKKREAFDKMCGLKNMACLMDLSS